MKLTTKFVFIDELHRLWEILLAKLADKGVKLHQAQVLVQFLRECDEVMFWINDKVDLSLYAFTRLSLSLIFSLLSFKSDCRKHL